MSIATGPAEAMPRPLSQRQLPMTAVIHWRGLMLGLCATVPLLALALATGSLDWLRASLLALSLVLSWLESGLTPLGVVLQAVGVIGLFLGLVACRESPWLFSLVCAASAAAAVRLAGIGARLRTLAAFSFIPAVYLAFDTAAESGARGLDAARAALPALAFSLAIVLGVMATTRWHPPVTEGWSRLFVADRLGAPRPYRASMAAAFLSVGVAALLATALPLASGQWAVWSALSIVMAEAGREGRKLRDRTFGATIGVPIGLALSFVVPHAPAVAPIALLLSMLTLVGIRHYLAGVLIRWGLVAFAAIMAGHAPVAGLERIADVIAGGVIGFGGVILARAVAERRPFARRRPHTERQER